ncbi:MAG TPA: hydrolase [Bdellovibrionales bacterium]|nr:hydrolase [Bdellovibrionales bacterium]
MFKCLLFGLLASAMAVLGGCNTMRHSGPMSDHFDGEKFFNPGHRSHKSFLDVLKWKLTETSVPWPEEISLTSAPWENKKVSPGKVRVTYVNHASILIQSSTQTILTDPVYSKRVSPLSWAGPKRRKLPGIPFENLPPIDVVLISHNHYDHMDKETLRRLQERGNPLVLAPLGDCRVLEDISGLRCEELDWWQKRAVDEVQIEFCPAQHWSARGMFDRNESLWGSYALQVEGKTIYFAGDTGFGNHFEAIAKRYPQVDLALLPIGAYAPRWFSKDHHLNPEEAVKAHQVLGAKKSLGIHFGTFKLTDEAYEEPAQRLSEELERLKISKEEFLAKDNGFDLWLE